MPEVTDPGLLAQLNGPPAAAPIPKAPPLRQVIAPQPKQPPAQTPLQVQGDELANRKAMLDIETKMKELEAGGLSEDARKAAMQAGNMNSLINQINRVQELYNQTLKGVGPGSVLEYLPTQANSAFDAAAAGVGEQGMAAFRVPGVGSQSDTELRQFVEANKPSSWANDAANEERLRQLRTRVDSVRETLGLPPAEWTGLDGQETPEVPPTASATAATPPTDSALTPPRFGPGDPQMERNTSGYKREDDPALAGVREGYARMLQESRPASEVVAYLRSAGMTDPEGLRTAAAQATFRRNNPEVPLELYDYEQIDDRLVPMSFFERAVNSDIAQPAVAALVGAGDTISMGTLDELAGEDAAAQMEALGNESPGATFAGQVAGGFLLPASRGAGAARMAGEAAGYGAAYGAGSAEGDLGDRAAGAVTGAALGAGTVAGLRGAGKLRNRVKQPPGGQDAVNLARAAEAEGVPISRPIVDPGARTKMARIEAQPGGATPVQQSMDATLEGLDEGATRLKGSGSAQEPGVMGQRIQAAAEADLKAQRGRAGDLYTKAAEQAGDTPIYPTEAVAELDRQIAALARNPNRNKATIGYLQTLRRDFVDAVGNPVAKSVDDIRSLRTDLSDEIKRRNLTSTNAERLTNRIIDRAGTDIKRDLGDAAPDAMNTYREADIRWKLAKRDERQVVERLIGPADRPMRGDQTMNAALAWLREGSEGRTLAARFWEKLPKRDQQDFAATVADKFGRRAADEPFSAAQFITATRNIPVSSRKLLFGEEGARSIANLRALSQAYKEAAGSLNNSRSGMVSNWANFIGGLSKGGIAGTVLGAMVGGVPGGAVGGVALSGAEALIRRVNARMLMNADMSRWLATAPQAQTPQAVTRHIEALSRVAARSPAIAQDALGLQKALTELMGQSPSRLAASDNPEEQ